MDPGAAAGMTSKVVLGWWIAAAGIQLAVTAFLVADHVACVLPRAAKTCDTKRSVFPGSADLSRVLGFARQDASPR